MTWLAIVHGEWHELGWVAALVVALAAATIVRRRRRDHPLSGWFVLMLGLPIVPQLLDSVLALLGAGDPNPSIMASLNLASQAINMLSVVASVYVLGLFPDGVVHRSWQRRILRAAWLLLAIPPALALSTRTVALPWYHGTPPIDNPFRIVPNGLDNAPAQDLLGIAWSATLVAILMLAARYRRMDARQRQRTRWLLLPVLVMVLGLTLNLLMRDSQPALVNLLLLLVSPLLAGSVTMALLAPPRVDVDRVLRRSLVHGVLWLAIAATYVVAGRAVGVAAGQRLSVDLAVTLAVVATLAFQPARAWLESVVDRWVFGSRTDPTRVIERLGNALAETYELDSLLPRMTAALQQGLSLEWAVVRLDGDDAVPATPGADDGFEAAPDVHWNGRQPALRVPIVHGGEQLGVVECGPRRSGELTDQDRAVVTTLARQAALAVHNVRLTTELAAQARELARSRTRLVRAQERERRRIERNIHDGVQQGLVALISQAGHVQQLQARDPTRVADALATLHTGLDRVLEDLRELVRGIHPSLLTDRGLLAAVEALAARNPVPVTVRADPSLRTLRLPEEVEGAGYFTVAEALTNSLRHADANAVDVTLARSNGWLRIRIRDDGVGLRQAPGHGWAEAGTGLANLSERVAALGGRLEVAGTPGEGTEVTAMLGIDPEGAAR